MINDFLPPGLFLLLAGLLLPWLKGNPRSFLVLGAPLVTLALVWAVPEGQVMNATFLGHQLVLLQSDALSRLFASVFAIATLTGGLFGLKQAKAVETASAYVYAGAAIGVVMAGDLLTLFVYWEIMALGSTMVIWSAGTPASYRASMRYLAMHLLGGVILMIGIAGQVAATGSLLFTAMQPDSMATWAILIGFLINAGAPPFSAWLPDAYPEASPFGTVFLSAFTTKTAVYVLMRGFPGAEVLIYFGLAMILYGILYALLENDMRRMLSYAIISAVGFMVVGIGIGTEMALNGVAALAFAHVVYKGLVMMAAGAVIHATGRRDCSSLGGLHRSMPFTAMAAVIGAMAMSSLPLTSGFVSKSLIVDAVAYEHIGWLWFALTAASAGILLHAGLRFPWFVFFDRDSGLRPADPPVNMRLAMILGAALCLLPGIFPGTLYGLLPHGVDYEPYTFLHVAHMLQITLFSALAFFLLRPIIGPAPGRSLDIDWFYRVLGKSIYQGASQLVSEFNREVAGGIRRKIVSVIDWIFRHHEPEGVMARTWSASSMVQWVLLVLGAYLLVYFI